MTKENKEFSLDLRLIHFAVRVVEFVIRDSVVRYSIVEEICSVSFPIPPPAGPDWERIARKLQLPVRVLKLNGFGQRK